MNTHSQNVVAFILLAIFCSQLQAQNIDQLAEQQEIVATYNDLQNIENEATTSVLTNSQYFNLAQFLGATTYYSNGITGQNSTTTVMEAGLIWNGHEALTGITSTNYIYGTTTFGGTNPTSKFDRHATWVGMLIGGQPTTNSILQSGLAYGTELNSAALATSWSGTAFSLNFGWSYSTWLFAITNSFQRSDVINQSYGYTDPAGLDTYTRMNDAFALLNSKVTTVSSAGNSGPSINTVGGPAAGYNTISVGAMAGPNTYNTVASFSSRGPQDWGYRKWLGGVTYSNVVVSNVQSPVDIVAPGSSILTAFYGGQTGGNNTGLTGSTNGGTQTNVYSSVNGTSFSAPLVSAGAALLISKAKTDMPSNNEARESMVVKALLMNGASKPTGWSNGQVTLSGVITTTQGMDYSMGAGMMNLAATYTNQVLGTTGVLGTNSVLDNVSPIGWDYGGIRLSGNNTYSMTSMLENSSFSATLAWMRQVTTVISTGANAVDIAQANLDLEIWSLNPNGSLLNMIATSKSTYNTAEHLSFQLPTNGYYSVRVVFPNNTFDNFGSWGISNNVQTYGLAWRANQSRSWDTIYWQGLTNTWSTNSEAMNGAANWAGTIIGAPSNAIGYTAAAVNAAFHGNFGTVQVSGAQFARGIQLSPTGPLQIGGTTVGEINVGTNGINMLPTAQAPATIGNTNVPVRITGSQTWKNHSSNTLLIPATITGTGDINLETAPLSQVTLSGQINHSGTVAHSGDGRVTITGSINSSVSQITQSGGRMRMEASANTLALQSLQVANGNMTVNSQMPTTSTTVVQGGLLDGNGSLGNINLLPNASMSAGDGIGTLAISGTLQLNPNSSILWQIGNVATSWDRIQLTGNGNINFSLLTPTAQAVINLWSINETTQSNGPVVNFNQLQTYTWDFITSELEITGFSPELFIISTTPTSYSGGFANAHNAGGFALNISQDNKSIFLTYTPVPEPTTIWAGIMLAILMTVGILKKTNKHEHSNSLSNSR